MDTLDSYRQMVHDFAIRRDGKPLYNASDEHAAIVVEEIFRWADNEVWILTGHLAPRIFARPGVLMWADIFLSDPDNELRLLVKEGDLPKLAANSAYEIFKQGPNVQVRALPDEVERTVAFRFMIADSDIYRFEPDKARCDAVAAFGSADVTQNLRSIYDDLWAVSYEVDRESLNMMPTLDYDEEQQAKAG